MTKIDKLVHEIQKLSRDELASFRDWFQKFDSDTWDRKIEEDIQAGKLDALADEAMAAHRLGRTRKL
jgi:hypothetical protein